MNFGLGYIYCKRDQSEAKVLEIFDETGSKQSIINYTIEKEISTTPRLLGAFGIEYVANNKSKKVYGLQTSFFYNLQKIKFIGQYNYSLELNIGLIIF